MNGSEDGVSEAERDYKSAILQTWIETRMEKDRSILTISSGGIGVLLALSAPFAIHGGWQLVVYGASLLAFTAAVVAAVFVFGSNSDYLEAIHTGDEPKKRNAARRLEWLDRILVYGFIAGIVFAVAFTSLKCWESFTGPTTNRSEQNESAK